MHYWSYAGRLAPLLDTGRQRLWTRYERLVRRDTWTERRALSGRGLPFELVVGFGPLPIAGRLPLARPPGVRSGFVFLDHQSRSTKEFRDFFCTGCGARLEQREHKDGQTEENGSSLGLGHDLPVCPAFDAAATIPEVDALMRVVARSEPAPVQAFRVRSMAPPGMRMMDVLWRASHEIAVTLEQDTLLVTPPASAVGEMAVAFAFAF